MTQVLELEIKTDSVHGAAEAAKLREYAEHTAKYIRARGLSVLDNATQFNARCQELAVALEEAAAGKADEIIDISTRLYDAAKGMEAVSRQFFGIESKGNGSGGPDDGKGE